MTDVISYLTSFSLWGSIVNAVMVIFGASVGVAVKHMIGKGSVGGTLERVSDALMKGMGLCVLLIGIMGALETNNVMIVIVSMLIGAVIGEICDLNKRVSSLGAYIEKKAKGKFGEITEGFVAASLLFCVGSMAVVGSLNSGLLGDHTMLYTKALIDMIAAFALASSLGVGVAFSALLLIMYQGTITLFAGWVAPFLNTATVAEMTAVGSLLIIAIALNMLEITKIKVMNYVPAIFIPIILCLFL
jgi:uncharacterized membrane protein YqgA involved in biofilm formation